DGREERHHGPDMARGPEPAAGAPPLEGKIATSLTLKLRSPAEALSLYGKNDEHLQLLRQKLRAKVVARGDELKLVGEEADVREAAATLRSLLDAIRAGAELSPAEIALGLFDGGDDAPATR